MTTATAQVHRSPKLPKSADPVKEMSVLEMVDDLSNALDSAISEIHSVNAETKVLALNARIEAARAGSAGSAFSVVAEEMQELSEKTSSIADQMAHRTRDKTSELRDLIGSTIKGTRLGDIALTNIDLIDRNLYERTCDVRWWATDSSLTSALAEKSDSAFEYASNRMGVILGAYTVYLDLVLCNARGTIVANANPSTYRSRGSDVSASPWFRAAMESHSGDDYAFQSANYSKLVGEQPALVYSCAVREAGASNGRPLGVLGILFNWAGLADPILRSLPLPPNELRATRSFIVNDRGEILASNGDEKIGTQLSLSDFGKVLAKPKGFFVTNFEGKECCVGHAKAPGFETYSTGWYSLIIQATEDCQA